MALTSPLLRTVAGPCPLVITSSFSEQKLTLKSGICVVGSDPQADYVLQEKTVSRRHLSLELIPEGVRVTDLGSTNGTGHGGLMVSEMVLSSHGELRLGRVTIRVNFELNANAEPSSEAAGNGTSSIAKQLERLEGSVLGVLLTGLPGTELEVAARTIHQHSRRCLGPWVTVNCAALNHEALQRELFGTRGGPLTALDGRAGAFARADGGTLFLDEVTELPLDLQAMLQRALHERDVCVQRGRPTARSTARVIAASHHDVSDLVRRGRFRPDLNRRLGVVTLHLASTSKAVHSPRRLAATLPLGFVPDR